MKPIALLLLPALLALPGCSTTQNAHRVPASELAREDTLVFVRPDFHWILGTRSIRDYVEITYEERSRNAAGLLEVRVGLRNRGGQRWYDLHGPNFALSAKTSFYREPIAGRGPTSAPVYETNWQTITLVRGDTLHFSVTCPAPEGAHYQLTLSEQVAR